MQDIQLSIEFGVSVLQKIVDAGYDFLKIEKQKRDVFGKATERYVKGLVERFGKVKVLGMSRPVPLLSLYVRANILEKISSRAGAKVEELEEFFDFDRRAFGKKVETKDGEEIANDLQRFIVLGKPGAGKTTFLKYLALAMVHKQSMIKQRRLPIFVTLRDWADRGISLMEYIVDQFDICGFDQAGLFVENILKQGGCLVLFDGLDEVSQEANLDGIIREIRDFTDKYSSNQYVMSCRVAAYNHWFERYIDVEMADFNQQQIETFVRNWFRDEPKTAEECLKLLTESPHLRELSTVPLLLTLLCITYDENNDFSTNRAELYKDAIETLLRKWDSSRRIRRDDPYRQLSLMQKENMFARIAYGTFTENRYFIREQDLAKMIGNFIGNLPAFKTENLEVDSTEVLRSIESHHGIFVARAMHIHSFAHLTFQEYFTAKYIANKGFPELENLVTEHLYDYKWKEVFLLITGMLPDADELLLLILKKNRELLCEFELSDLLNTANKALLPSESGYSDVIRKSMALFLIFSFVIAWDIDISRILDVARTNNLDIVRDYDLTSGIDFERPIIFLGVSAYLQNLVQTFDIDLTRANDLTRDLNTAIKLSRDLDRALNIDLSKAVDRGNDIDKALSKVRDRAHALDRVLNHARNRANAISRILDIDINVIEGNNLSTGIVEKIINFLNANILIAQCLSAAAYISKSTREYVLSQMLAPREECE